VDVDAARRAEGIIRCRLVPDLRRWRFIALGPRPEQVFKGRSSCSISRSIFPMTWPKARLSGKLCDPQAEGLNQLVGPQ